ncbi:NAD(P)-dependent dehydrogenase (short-subunit alcohol dehydrogenase family) [Salinibacterium sp. CAN_S4]|uniref:SDR family oxidoreductase n=1 Tax=Salinibacterium sp. CAN_S4 TaxID=2787727 RepID=UPI001A25E69F
MLTVDVTADITVVDRDPCSVTPDDLGEAVVLLTPFGRSGSLEDVAYAFAYLASDGASCITAQLIPVDGTNSISEERGRQDPETNG